MRSFFVVGLCFIVRLCFVVDLCFVKAAAVSFCSSLLFFLSVGLFVFAARPIGLYRSASLVFTARLHWPLPPGLFVWIVWSVLSLSPGHLLIEFVVPQGVVHRRVGRNVIPYRHKEAGAAHPFAFCRRDSSQSRRGCVFAASSPSTPILPFAV